MKHANDLRAEYLPLGGQLLRLRRPPLGGGCAVGPALRPGGRLDGLAMSRREQVVAAAVVRSDAGCGRLGGGVRVLVDAVGVIDGGGLGSRAPRGGYPRAAASVQPWRYLLRVERRD